MKITAEFALKTAQEQRDIPKNSRKWRRDSGSRSEPWVEDWIKTEIGLGLLFLKSCSLKFAPRPEKITEVRDAWAVVFRKELGVPIREIDEPRIREAFKKAGDFEEWPAAAAVARLMPPRPQRRALDNLPEPNPERDLAAIRKIQTMLSGGKK